MSDTSKLLLLWVVLPTLFMLIEGTWDYRKKRIKHQKDQQWR
jgi:hypothetical protein